MKKFKFSIDGNNFEASVEELENGKIDVIVNGSNYIVEVDREASKVSNQPAATPKASKVVAAPAAPAAVSATKTVKSQLPGSIVKILAAEGQAVKKGDTVMTIESMKMENNISAEADGTIAKIYVEPGKSVMQDDKLYDIAVNAPAHTPVHCEPKPVAKPAPVASPAPKSETAPAAGKGKPVQSPLPGSIVKILVTEGQSVKRGDTILTMESMKMENEIKAEKDGVITAIKVSAGQSVMQGDDLVIMA